jgi:hypothetical protein
MFLRNYHLQVVCKFVLLLIPYKCLLFSWGCKPSIIFSLKFCKIYTSIGAWGGSFVAGVVPLWWWLACFCRRCDSSLASLFGRRTTVPMIICQRGKSWVALSSWVYLGSQPVPYWVIASLQAGVFGQACQGRRCESSCWSSLRPFRTYSTC